MQRLLCLILFTTQFAQAEVRAIFPSSGKPRAIVDGRAYTLKWYENTLDLGDALASNREAQEHYLEYKSLNHWSSIIAWSALAAALGYLVVVDKSKFDGGTFAAITGVPLGLSTFLHTRGHAKLNRAFNLFNGVQSDFASRQKPNPLLALSFNLMSFE